MIDIDHQENVHQQILQLQDQEGGIHPLIASLNPAADQVYLLLI